MPRAGDEAALLVGVDVDHGRDLLAEARGDQKPGGLGARAPEQGALARAVGLDDLPLRGLQLGARAVEEGLDLRPETGVLRGAGYGLARRARAGHPSVQHQVLIPVHALDAHDLETGPLCDGLERARREVLGVLVVEVPERTLPQDALGIGDLKHNRAPGRGAARELAQERHGVGHMLEGVATGHQGSLPEGARLLELSLLKGEARA